MKIKKLNKKELEKFIHNIDNEIIIRYGKNFECDVNKKIVWVGLNQSIGDDLTFTNFLQTIDKNYYNLFIISLLHEIGHLQTYTLQLDNERTELYSLQSLALQMGIINRQQANFEYFNIPMERKATDWARHYYNLCKPAIAETINKIF